MAATGTSRRHHRSAPQHTLLCWAIAATAGIIGCSSPDAESAATPTTTPRAGTVIVPPTVPAPASDTAKAVVAQVTGDGPAGALTLDNDQRRCLEDRLDRDPPLRDALASTPTPTGIDERIRKLAHDCINATTIADSIAANIATQAGSQLPPAQIGCLRDSLANWPAEDLTGLFTAGVTPGSAPASTGPQLTQTLTNCGVDPESLKP